MTFVDLAYIAIALWALVVTVICFALWKTW